MVADLENLDATLRLFDPNISAETIKLKAFDRLRTGATWRDERIIL